MLASHAQAALDQLGSGDPLRDALAAAIRTALAGGEPTGIETIAAALRMTPRTLQRRLAARGTSLQTETAAVRCALAQDLLRDSQVSIAEIAARLGFADTANFHRAFKGWTGRTATQWRRGA
jgi:AraC-like DNA-binding protein